MRAWRHMLVGDGSAQNRIGRRESTGARSKQLMEGKNKDNQIACGKDFPEALRGLS